MADYPMFQYNPGVDPDTGKGLAAGISQLGSGIAGAMEKHEVDLAKDAGNDAIFGQAMASGEINPQILGYKVGENPTPAEMQAKWSGQNRQWRNGVAAALVGNYVGKLQQEKAQTDEMRARAGYLRAQTLSEGAEGNLGTNVNDVVDPVTGQRSGFLSVTRGNNLQLIPSGVQYTKDPQTGLTTVVHGRTSRELPESEIMMAGINKQRDAALAEAKRKEQEEGTPGLYAKAKEKWDDIVKSVRGTPPAGKGAAGPAPAGAAAPTGPAVLGPTPAGPPIGGAGQSLVGDQRTTAIAWLAKNGYAQNEENINEVLRQMGGNRGQ
jgi:hypothetical protein